MSFFKKKYKISSLDNLSRKGSKYNLELLKKRKINNHKFNINDTYDWLINNKSKLNKYF